jgi:hypothetical protein
VNVEKNGIHITVNIEMNEINIERNGIHIRDWDAPIYRIFSFERAIELFRTGYNVMVNPSTWDDPYENFLLKNGAVDNKGNIIDMQKAHKKCYGQCWTLVNESDAMWRIYSKDKRGVRLSSTIKKLFTSFYHHYFFGPLACWIGQVEYLDRDDILKLYHSTDLTELAIRKDLPTIVKTFLVKRRAFEHEREVRLLFLESGKRIGPDKPGFRLKPNEILDDVLLDPRQDAAGCSAMEAELRQAGCSLSIERSDLYDPPTGHVRLGAGHWDPSLGVVTP